MSNDLNLLSLEESIKKAENLLAILSERVNRLKQKDSVFSALYVQNMQAFSEIMPHVYEEFVNYIPENKNIYVEACGDLNLFRSDLGQSIFGREPKKTAQMRMDSTLGKPNRTRLNVERSRGHNSRHVYYNNLMSETSEQLSKGMAAVESMPDFVGSMVFFGLEFGYQLDYFLSKKQVKHLYVYERNLDFFYYSLFCIDWRQVLEKFNRDGRTLHLILGVDGDELTKKYVAQLAENGYFMSGVTYLHVSYISPENDIALEYFKKHYVTQIMGWGFFDDALIGIAHGLRGMPKSKIAIHNPQNPLPNWIKDIPVYIVGNGPSLDTAIELIRSTREKVLIISCGSTINTLKKLDITPDMHVDVERLKQTVDKFHFIDDDYLDDIIGLTVDVMHPDFYDRFNKVVVGLKPGEAITSLFLNNVRSEGDMSHYVQLTHCNPLVANLALSYVHFMGFRNVYLMGVDNGYKDVHTHHSKFSGYFKEDGKESGFQTFVGMRTHPREGNFGGVIHSTDMMETSRVQIELLLKMLNVRKGFACFNASDGAKVEGAFPVLPEDVMILDPDIDRRLVRQHIYDNCFTVMPSVLTEKTPDQLIAIADFKQVVRQLKSGWLDDFATREQVCDLLWRQYRQMYLLKATVHSHIYDLLVGSFTYSAFAMVRFVFEHQDEALVVSKAKQLFDIWCNFLDEMPAMVANVSEFVDSGNEHLLRYYNG